MQHVGASARRGISGLCHQWGNIMRLTLSVLAVLLALPSCAHTSKGYLEQAPNLELSSAKTPEKILGCINEVWQRQGQSTQYTPLQNGGTISVALPTLLISTGNLLMLVDAETIQETTRIRLYIMKGLSSKSDDATAEQIRKCA
jgi:hypothetical protein